MIKKKIRNACRIAYKFLTLKILYPMIYRLSSIGGVKRGRVLFIEVRLPKLSNNFTLLWDRLSMDGKYTTELFCLSLGSCSTARYTGNAMSLARKAARAEFIFLNEGSTVFSSLPISDKTTVIQTWHACGAFKRVGISAAGNGNNVSGSQRERKMFPMCRHMDYITVSSPEVIWAYEEAFDLHEGDGQQIVATGTSRTDIYFDEDRIRSAAARIRSQIPAAEGKKIILYAPTFRGETTDAVLPDAMDIEAMCRELSDEYVLVFKHHPVIKEKQHIPESCSGFAFDMTGENIDDLLMAADLCITDYSSLVFEFCLLDRPMVFFAYDYDDYLDWRGFYYPFEEFCPGEIVSDTDQLIRAIKNHACDHMDQIKTFREKFMSSCDGHATDRIIALMERHK